MRCEHLIQAGGWTPRPDAGSGSSPTSPDTHKYWYPLSSPPATGAWGAKGNQTVGGARSASHDAVGARAT